MLLGLQMFWALGYFREYMVGNKSEPTLRIVKYLFYAFTGNPGMNGLRYFRGFMVGNKSSPPYVGWARFVAHH